MKYSAEEERRLSKYLDHRPKMKSGDIIEFSNDSTLGKLIRWFTKKDVNHTALLLAPSYFLGLKHRKLLLEALEGGIEPNLLSERILHSNGRVYWLPLSPDYDDRRQEMVYWSVETYLVRKPKYDYPSLLVQAFSKVSLNGKMYFCSEWVHTSCIKAGILSSEEDARRPGEFGDITMPRVKIYDKDWFKEE